MQIDQSLPLLGGLSPAQFMRRHWQKKPLLIRQAFPGIVPPVTRAQAFELAAQEGVESRLIVHAAAPAKARKPAWKLRQGPIARTALPPLRQPGWTLLVQGLDLHVPAAHALLQQFRFVPQARLDDLMISYATEGGGVGPHLDSYDVFLLQVQGRRRWRIGPVADRTLVDGVPLKILANFQPQQEWLLEPGDMLYLPPMWGHDGVAEGGECMTCSIGFRAPSRGELARDLLQRLADIAADAMDDDTPGAAGPLYRDPSQPATAEPGRVPVALGTFAVEAVQRLLADDEAVACAVGEVLSEPKASVWFEPGAALAGAGAVQLDARTRMMYDDRHVFINGESFRAGGRDAKLMRRLADEGALDAADVGRLSADALGLLSEWARAGWVRGQA
ncbi:JmjC domain-containing protein [Aquincola sp. J276]|uniref:JmjC domain-containing protein n=1 Tax=Aquincola sp. J276 TaxID=2898432 RepID=UPI002151A171|nr:cupin domain-containing protein [Aquincola sp. J276]MCR5865257.1 cupin domain-containing protein [Aquincola sp. J276]